MSLPASLTLCAALLFVGAVGGAPAHGDWPGWRGPLRDGTTSTPLKHLVWPPQECWRAAVGPGFASCAVRDGRLFTVGRTGTQDRVVCLDALAGQERWAFSYDCGAVEYDGPRATPAIAGDELFVVGQDGQLLCLRAVDGALLWRRTFTAGRPRWGFAGSPLVLADRVVLAAGSGGIAIDRRPPHDVLWQTDGVAGYASPLPCSVPIERAALFFSQAGLVCTDLAVGTVRWWLPMRGGFNVPDPVLCGGAVFVAAGRQCPTQCFDLKGERPRLLWAGDALQSECAAAVYRDGFLYGFDDDEALACVDARTGVAAWRTSTPVFREGALINVGDKLIVLTADGALLPVRATPERFDAQSRDPYRLSTPDEEDWPAAPAFAGDLLFCRSRQGTLIGLRIEAGTGTKEQP